MNGLSWMCCAMSVITFPTCMPAAKRLPPYGVPTPRGTGRGKKRFQYLFLFTGRVPIDHAVGVMAATLR